MRRVVIAVICLATLSFIGSAQTQTKKALPITVDGTSSARREPVPPPVEISEDRVKELAGLRQGMQIANFAVGVVKAKLVDKSSCNQQVIDAFETESRAATAAYDAALYRLRAELLGKDMKDYVLSNDGKRFEPPPKK
jgi:hypothetical protein